MNTSVEFFLTVKTCSHGIKKAAECDQLNKSHTDLGVDIHISPGATSKNPGMKIAKLCLSSQWGKLGQCSGMDSFG